MACGLGVWMLVGAASAQATITATAITSPSSPFRYQFDNNRSPAPTVTITGTTNSTSAGSDRVDINCYYDDQWGSSAFVPIAGNVALRAGGGFSWTGPVNVKGETCELRAVPHGFGDSYPTSPFAGVFSELDFLSRYSVNGASPVDDFYYTATSTAAYDDYDSVGGCGLHSARAINPGNESYDEFSTWNCAAALYNSDGSGQRSEILVDAKNAYDSYTAARQWYDSGLKQYSAQAPGAPSVSSSYTSDPLTGNVTIHESEGLVSCANASFPATQAKCGGSAGAKIGTWRSDGVSLERTITQTNGGQLVTVADTYSSADGRAHSLDVEYDNYSYEDGNTVWQMPGQAQYTAYAKGDQPNLAGRSEDVIYTKDGFYPDGNPYDGPGALIFTTQPSSALFTSFQGLLLDYRRAVPAGGSITITHEFVTGADQASVSRLANRQLDQAYGPTVAITSPHSGTVIRQSSIQLVGRASAHDGLTLRVAGEAVGVNADGTWSTAVSLVPGVNRITAVAADASGNSAQAAITVAYSAQRFCIVPRVVHDTLRRAKAALRRADCRVGRISRVHSRTFRRGRVEHASYGSRLVLRAGTRVGLTESVGRPVAHSRARKS